MSDSAGSVRSVHPAEAERLVTAGAVHVVDVRTPSEFTGTGHIPGALLLPVDLVASGPATLPRDGRPLLVVCEHGVRSAHAAGFLARAGFDEVLNMSGGMACWSGPREHDAAADETFRGPSSWLLQNADLIPWGGKALDVACGAGRHALLLAAAGLKVDAVDRDADKLDGLGAAARRLELPLRPRNLDLESEPPPDLGSGIYDLVLVFRFLHRPLFPALIAALRPGGLLLVETFTTAQAAAGHPRNPEFLLQPGELPGLLAPLNVVRHREGEADGAQVAAAAALKPAAA